MRRVGLRLLALARVPRALARDDLVGRQARASAPTSTAALRVAAGARGGVQDDGERRLRDVERQDRRALELEVAPHAAGEVLDGGAVENGPPESAIATVAGGISGRSRIGVNVFASKKRRTVRRAGRPRA